MEEFYRNPCIPCHSGESVMTKEEIKTQRTHIPDWELIDSQGVTRLQRVFLFKNFKQALAFTNKIGEIAEQEGHHPAILTEWGKVTVTWWTHTVQGLHLNDFILAARTDKLV